MMTNLKDQIKETSPQKIYFYLSLPSIVIAFFLSLIIFLFFEFLPSKVPLFYSLSWGEPQLATHQQFYILPLSILLITLINLTVLFKLNSSADFFKKIIAFSTIVSTIILVVTFIKISLIFI